MDIPIDSEVFDFMPNLVEVIRTPRTPQDKEREADGVLEFMRAKGISPVALREMGNYLLKESFGRRQSANSKRTHGSGRDTKQRTFALVTPRKRLAPLRVVSDGTLVPVNWSEDSTSPPKGKQPIVSAAPANTRAAILMRIAARDEYQPPCESSTSVVEPLTPRRLRADVNHSRRAGSGWTTRKHEQPVEVDTEWNLPPLCQSVDGSLRPITEMLEDSDQSEEEDEVPGQFADESAAVQEDDDASAVQEDAKPTAVQESDEATAVQEADGATAVPEADDATAAAEAEDATAIQEVAEPAAVPEVAEPAAVQDVDDAKEMTSGENFDFDSPSSHSVHVTTRRKSKLLTPAQAQYWYESNCSPSQSNSTPDGASPATPSGSAKGTASPLEGDRIARVTRASSRGLTPAQPQYWYETNESPMAQSPIVESTTPSHGVKESPSARRSQRKRRESTLHTPLQPQYWYEANLDECTTPPSSAKPQVGEAAVAEAAKEQGVQMCTIEEQGVLSSRRRRMSRQLTPMQPQYWYEQNADDGCPPANGRLEDVPAPAASPKVRVAPSSDPGRLARSASSPGALGFPKTTGKRMRSSVKGLATITEAKESPKNAALQKYLSAAQSPIVPVALNFTPQKRVRFSDQSEQPIPAPCFSPKEDAIEGADWYRRASANSSESSDAHTTPAGLALAWRGLAMNPDVNLPPAQIAVINRDDKHHNNPEDAEDLCLADRPPSGTAYLVTSESNQVTAHPPHTSDPASASPPLPSALSPAAQVGQTGLSLSSSSPCSLKCTTPPLASAAKGDPLGEARSRFAPRLGNATPAHRIASEASYNPYLFEWSETEAVPALRSHLQETLLGAAALAAPAGTSELAAHLQRLDAAKGIAPPPPLVTLHAPAPSPAAAMAIAGAISMASRQPGEPAPPPMSPQSGFDMQVTPASSRKKASPLSTLRKNKPPPRSPAALLVAPLLVVADTPPAAAAPFPSVSLRSAHSTPAATPAHTPDATPASPASPSADTPASPFADTPAASPASIPANTPAATPGGFTPTATPGGITPAATPGGFTLTAFPAAPANTPATHRSLHPPRSSLALYHEFSHQQRQGDPSASPAVEPAAAAGTTGTPVALLSLDHLTDGEVPSPSSVLATPAGVRACVHANGENRTWVRADGLSSQASAKTPADLTLEFAFTRRSSPRSVTFPPLQPETQPPTPTPVVHLAEVLCEEGRLKQTSGVARRERQAASIIRRERLAAAAASPSAAAQLRLMVTPDPHPPSAHGVDIATSPMVTPMATPIAARPTSSNHQADAAEEEEQAGSAAEEEGDAGAAFGSQVLVSCSPAASLPAAPSPAAPPALRSTREMAFSPAPTASTSAHMSSSSWENVQVSTAQHTLPTPYRAALPPRPAARESEVSTAQLTLPTLYRAAPPPRPTPSAARDKWDVSPPVARDKWDVSPPVASDEWDVLPPLSRNNDKWDVSPPVAHDEWELPPPAARESAVPSTSGRESAIPAAASAATAPGQEVIVIEDSDDEDVGGYDVGDDGSNWGVGHTENEQVVPFGPSPPSSSGGGVRGVTPRDLFYSPNGGGEEEEETGNTPAAVVPRGRAVVTQTARLPRTPAEAKNQHLKQWANKRKSLSGAGMQALSNGTRRSTRHRVRPLEYWRNEKVVYSRKYSSLPTLTHVEMHTPDPMWPAPAPKRRKEQIRLLKN